MKKLTLIAGGAFAVCVVGALLCILSGVAAPAAVPLGIVAAGAFLVGAGSVIVQSWTDKK